MFSHAEEEHSRSQRRLSQLCAIGIDWACQRMVRVLLLSGVAAVLLVLWQLSRISGGLRVRGPVIWDFRITGAGQRHHLSLSHAGEGTPSTVQSADQPRVPARLYVSRQGRRRGHWAAIGFDPL